MARLTVEHESVAGMHGDVAPTRAASGHHPVKEEADRRRAIALLARRGFAPGAAWEAVRDATEDLTPDGKPVR